MKRFTKFLLVGGLVAAGQLWAQPLPGAKPDPNESGSSVKAPKPARELTPAEMLTRGTQLEEQVQTDTRHVQHLQVVARREKDVLKLSCVNDKLVKLKGHANIVDAALVKLRGSQGESKDAFSSATEHAQNVAKDREEAQACVGETELGQESNSDFTKPDLPDDPTKGGVPFGENAVVEPPGYASPYT